MSSKTDGKEVGKDGLTVGESGGEVLFISNVWAAGENTSWESGGEVLFNSNVMLGLGAGERISWNRL